MIARANPRPRVDALLVALAAVDPAVLPGSAPDAHPGTGGGRPGATAGSFFYKKNPSVMFYFMGKLVFLCT